MYSKENTKKTWIQALHGHLIATRQANLQKIFSSFEEGNYRTEYVKTIREIDFIDDAGAKNGYSTWYALEKMQKPVTWITNIHDLDEIEDDLALCVAKKVKRIVMQGMYNAEMVDFFSGIGIEVAFAVTMEDAVRVAFYASSPSQAVLYSPGTGDFRNLGEAAARSNSFKNAIAQL